MRSQGRRPTAKRYSLSFTREQLLSFSDALEGYHTHLLDADELKTHDKLQERIDSALSKANVDEIADLVFL